MEYRQLGRSGLKVPVLSLGTGTFGGTNEFFQRWGQTDVAQAKRTKAAKRETKFEQAANFSGALKGLFLHVELIQPRLV
jgi:aryl-alcohol dehydrogenase-like predicted oxidoreductase